MSPAPLKIVIIGLTVTSSWGNGHATTYRSLLKELKRRGHDCLFLEHDKPWYASNRDLSSLPFARVELYASVAELEERWEREVQEADVVIVGSYVPEGVRVGRWVNCVAEGVTGFYDIDTPVTLAKLARGDFEYLSPELIPLYDIYLSFTGGPTLAKLEQAYGSPRARALYCSVDPELYYPEGKPALWELGYLGTYSDDRQPTLERLLLEPARKLPERRFVVAGPQYPESIRWGRNVERIDHLAPEAHRDFYNRMRFTLNVTRRDMIAAGYSPSVRLFEAAACGVPILSDYWDGLESFFKLGEEILVAGSAEEAARILRETSEPARLAIGERARARTLEYHSAARRALELETYLNECRREQTTPAERQRRLTWNLKPPARPPVHSGADLSAREA